MLGPSAVTLFLCGDVMTGRGVDQILPRPNQPSLREDFVANALDYVELAERKNGEIGYPVDFSYIWGDALAELDRVRPDLRLINLETTITCSEDWCPKGINYRMHPGNVACLTAAKIDCCSLANNHMLDFGPSGLSETLETLQKAGIKRSGAGRDLREAQAPALFELGGRTRVVIFAAGAETSGVPAQWAAGESRPGLDFLPDLGEPAARRLAGRIRAVKRPGDIVVFSVHWGSNWGYEIPPLELDFAHRLIDQAGVDVVWGHSSHHPKGIEVYRRKLILYGCGDFINDYEGISGYEEFQSELCLMYFAAVDRSTGEILGLNMAPLEIKRLRLGRASRQGALRLADLLSREGRRFGTSVKAQDDKLSLRWDI